MFTFTPLLGSQSTSGASQSILELDGGVKILVDVGWDAQFDVRQLAALEKHASTLSFILLTHPTISHLGAFVHCSKHIPVFSQIPVYATPPVIAFGRTLLQDLYSSTPLAATFIPDPASLEDEPSTEGSPSRIFRQTPSAEEITKSFSSIIPLKYSQPHQPTASQFSAPLEGLTLTAFASGHTLGGTVWHIQHGMETIVYAVDWNQSRENVIAGAAWFGGVGGSEVLEQLRKPTALVCSSKGADQVALSGGRKARDDALLAHIRSCLAKGGTVLIPSDSSARVLELAWILEKTWHEGSNDPPWNHAKVYLASKSAQATLRHARSLLEWMDDSIIREFEGEDDTATKTHRRGGSRQANGQTAKPSRPFEFTHVKVVERKAQLERALAGDGPKVIIASDLSLEWGFSKTALFDIAQKPENLIILTERLSSFSAKSVSSKQSPYSRLWAWYLERQDGVALEKSSDGEQIEQVHTGGRSITITDVHRTALDDAETTFYQQYMATRGQLESSTLTNNENSLGADDGVDDDSSSSSEDESDDEHQGRALNVSAALGHGARAKVAITDQDLGVGILMRKKGVYDFDVRNKKGRNAVFPYTHSRRRGDEFGDYIRPEDYLRAEEKEEVDGGVNAKTNEIIGQKRKWEDKAKDDRNSKRQQVRQAESGFENSKEAAADVADDSDSSESDTDVQADNDLGPAKATTREFNISVNARLAFVDFAGLHDQRSLQMLIPLIAPKKLILTSGTKQEIASLAADCKDLLSAKFNEGDERDMTELLTPLIGQTVDASVDTNAWVLKLGRDLVKRLHWQNVRNLGVVTLTGQLKGEPVQSQTVLPERNKKQKLVKEEQVQPAGPVEMPESLPATEPLLDVIPVSMAASTRTVAQPIHVGDLRLADLRRLMNAAGHGAEFRGEGTLLIDNMVAVRKLGTGKIVVEGVPVHAIGAMSGVQRPDSFTQVKRKIYEGLAVVAAG